MSANSSGVISAGKARYASEEDFNKYRDVITELYHKATVPGIMEEMETRYGFFAM